MTPTEIKRNRSYVTRQGWTYRVTDIADGGTDDACVAYTVTQGDMAGTSGTAPIHDFAGRVVREVANQVVTLKGGL